MPADFPMPKPFRDQCRDQRIQTGPFQLGPHGKAGMQPLGYAGDELANKSPR